MTSSREIINDMRAQAAALDGRHVSGSMMDGVCRSLRRGADEIERLLDDLVWLRGYAEIPQEEDAA
ncbi:hypothetical protein [Paracoccus sp. (in: a-proteobacteria)]|uniref:hypothetical protein n=1 Tax=Paracoccus sp. TaxID=267 RepID=UPI00272AE95B|nr:hypothetical protein [Paracoccus sp. (in: a-proteobacteria)]